MLDLVGVLYVLNEDEILEYEPVEEIFHEVIKRYPELEKINSDTVKKHLKPIVMYTSDLDTLEDKLINIYGQNSVHKALPSRSVGGRDVRMDSQMNDEEGPDDQAPDDREPSPPKVPIKKGKK